MAAPHVPVIMKDASCDRDGVLVSWMLPENETYVSHTISWKAESWWQAMKTTVPGMMKEFMISELPPNEKLSVWMFSTNKNASSAWSEAVTFVTTRDCGVKGEVQKDIDVPCAIPAADFHKFMYTPEFDKFAVEAGLIGTMEQIKYEEKDNEVHKIVRITPPIPPSVKSLIKSFVGDQILTYDEESIKYMDRYEVKFKITGLPASVQSNVEVAEGELRVVDVDGESCRLEGFFDLRIQIPVVGYYLAKVIRTQAITTICKLPASAETYFKNRAK